MVYKRSNDAGSIVDQSLNVPPITLKYYSKLNQTILMTNCDEFIQFMIIFIDEMNNDYDLNVIYFLWHFLIFINPLMVNTDKLYNKLWNYLCKRLVDKSFWDQAGCQYVDKKCCFDLNIQILSQFLLNINWCEIFSSLFFQFDGSYYQSHIINLVKYIIKTVINYETASKTIFPVDWRSNLIQNGFLSTIESKSVTKLIINNDIHDQQFRTLGYQYFQLLEYLHSEQNLVNKQDVIEILRYVYTSGHFHKVYNSNYVTPYPVLNSITFELYFEHNKNNIDVNDKSFFNAVFCEDNIGINNFVHAIEDTRKIAELSQYCIDLYIGAPFGLILNIGKSLGFLLDYLHKYENANKTTIIDQFVQKLRTKKPIYRKQQRNMGLDIMYWFKQYPKVEFYI